MSSGSSNDFMIFGLEVTTLPPPFLRNRKNHQNLPKSWSRDQQKRFWGGPQATTKTPKKIFFEKIIFEPQHIQKLSESGQGARKTVQNRQICQKFTNFSQNLQTLPKSNCRTTLVPTVVLAIWDLECEYFGLQLSSQSFEAIKGSKHATYIPSTFPDP